MTVLIIVILVPIIVFGATQFITSSVLRYATQTRTLKAMYLAQAGIHRAIFNIDASTSPVLSVSPAANNTINVTADVVSITKWGLTSTGASTSPTPSLQRIVYAEYDSAIHRVSAYREKPVTSPLVFPFTFYGYKWGMDENTGTTTGTTPVIGALAPAGAYPIWVAGRVRNALNFNQTGTNNYVQIPDHTGLDLLSAGSLMAWIRMTTLASTGAAIMRRGNATAATTNQTYALLINIPSGSNRRVQFSLCTGTPCSGANLHVATGKTNLAINTWYHVAGTWGAGGLCVYLNGVEDETTHSGTVYASYNPAGTVSLFIGSLVTTAGSSTKFQGTIDEAYIHARQLTAAEILAYYNAT